MPREGGGDGTNKNKRSRERGRMRKHEERYTFLSQTGAYKQYFGIFSLFNYVK